MPRHLGLPIPIYATFTVDKTDQIALTNIMDELFNLALHSPVVKLNTAELVGTHDGFSVGKWHWLSLEMK